MPLASGGKNDERIGLLRGSGYGGVIEGEKSQIENKLDAVVRYEMAGRIPLVKQ